MAAVVESTAAAVTAAAGAAGPRRGFLSQTQATAPVDAVVHGRLPAWLRGSLLLNGPAIWTCPLPRTRIGSTAWRCCTVCTSAATAACATTADSSTARTRD